jgi:hypothetical protein
VRVRKVGGDAPSFSPPEAVITAGNERRAANRQRFGAKLAKLHQARPSGYDWFLTGPELIARRLTDFGLGLPTIVPLLQLI